MELLEYIDNNTNRSGIYCIFNMRNGKLYIGSAKYLNQRVKTHISHLTKNKHCNYHLQSAWNKYGIISFLFVVIEYCPENKLIEKENYWLSQFDFDAQLYNICETAASTLGRTHSIEVKEKMRKANSGKKHTNDVKIKIGNVHRGKVVTNVTRKNMSDAKRMTGWAKPIVGTNLVNGEELIFMCAKDAAGYFGKINGSFITSVLKNKRNHTAGYYWQYVDNQN